MVSRTCSVGGYMVPAVLQECRNKLSLVASWFQENPALATRKLLQGNLCSEAPTHKPWHASFFRMHSDTEAGPTFFTEKQITCVSKRAPGVHGKRGLERGWQKTLEKGWRKVGEGLAKGWHRVGEGLAKGRRVSLHGAPFDFAIPEAPIQKSGFVTPWFNAHECVNTFFDMRVLKTRWHAVYQFSKKAPKRQRFKTRIATLACPVLKRTFFTPSNRSPGLGSPEGGHPDLFWFLRILLICSNLRSFFSGIQCPDLFKSLHICSDFFWFVVRTNDWNQNKSGKPPSAHPFCKSSI